MKAAHQRHKEGESTKDRSVEGEGRRFILNSLLLSMILFTWVGSVCGEGEMSGAEPTTEAQSINRDRVKDPTQMAIHMMEEVRRREEGLAAREEEIRRKEDKLKALELDLQEAIKQLEIKQQELLALRERLSQEEEDRLHQLAKVFDAAPPEQGGKLLSELAPETAARVLQRMNSRRAGRLWGFVDPQKAAEISEILARKKE
jgi:flagellar motility protein MotE (MotC chaperone)